MKVFVGWLLACSLVASAQHFTRGIGVYPGDPKQYDGPTMVIDRATYRNLALHRPAYQSSAYDYNLTAQLITDGIKKKALPQWITTFASDRGMLNKLEREVFLDGSTTSILDVTGDRPWIEFDVDGGRAPEIDHLDLHLRKIYGPAAGAGWTIVVFGSNDRSIWRDVGRAAGPRFPEYRDNGPSFKVPITLTAPVNFRCYRVEMFAPGVHTWGVADVVLFGKGREVRISGPENFSSAWMSAGSGEEWVSVDLGANCTFDRIHLLWILGAAEGALQISGDNTHWQTLQSLHSSAVNDEEIHLPKPEHGRYVRVLMTKPAKPGCRYVLSEVEVYGRGGPLPVAKAAPRVSPDGSLRMSAGNWKLQRASEAPANGEQISTAGFADKDWMIATVPGTVLTSFLNDGAIVDPNFGENQYAISDSFFCADFWYRNEFMGPAVRSGRHLWLNFDGINWKAEIYLNGKRLGRIDGAFMRGRFDVTGLVHPGVRNALAVRILRNTNPGSVKDKAGSTVNGGALGRDNPSFDASVGWDWMPTIRGRNTGIWSDVTLTTSGAVSIENPLVSSGLPLPDTSRADVTIEASVHNHEAHAVTGTLRAKFGNIAVSTRVTLEPSSTKVVRFTPAGYAALHVAEPKLWWPNGYGEPNLYPVKLSFVVGGRVSDETSFKSGIRQFTHSEDGGILKIWINGRRFIARGGNWGFPESNLRYRAREYNIALRYHRDENFNMIRDWVGQTADQAFYDAADRYGMVIWQDFWLANPWDGPIPDDNNLFLANARDYLLRIRNHASLGIFCGRNEGYPPKPIDDGLRALVAQLEPRSHYISSSADGPVDGRGPYHVEPLKAYFLSSPLKLHSEIGSPNVPEMDILRRTLSAPGMWPLGSQWRLHDFYGNNPFAEAIDRSYGGAKSVEEWTGLAQFVNYGAYRAMFEGQSRNRPGMLIWMSHPAWPSLVWQTYDYFFDTDAGYYGAKKASEPLHIQWNAAADTVEVVNYSAGDQTGLTARTEIIDLDGQMRWEKNATIDSREDSTVSPIHLEYPARLARTHFLRLTLMRGSKVLSTNFYLRGNAEEDYGGLRMLAPAHVIAHTRALPAGLKWQAAVELHNVSTVPALMVRVKAVRERSGDLILPAFYDDNYIALMPGESRTLHVELENADARGQRPRIRVEGFNLRTNESR